MIRYFLVEEHTFASKRINSIIFERNFQKAEKKVISFCTAADFCGVWAKPVETTLIIRIINFICYLTKIAKRLFKCNFIIRINNRRNFQGNKSALKKLRLDGDFQGNKSALRMRREFGWESSLDSVPLDLISLDRILSTSKNALTFHLKQNNHDSSHSAASTVL